MPLVYAGLLLFLTFGFISLLIVSFLTLLFIFPMSQGAVYVPSQPAAIAAMIALGKVKKGCRVAELGCGDGRVVVALAQTGAEVHGYEINPLLVWKARSAIKKVGLSGRAYIHLKSYWQVDFGQFDVITIYGIPYIMANLQNKLQSELPGGARVVSNQYTFPTWKASKSSAGVYLYIQPGKTKQTAQD